MIQKYITNIVILCYTLGKECGRRIPMAESALNFTTLLSELTKEQLKQMHNLPDRDPLLPDNKYLVAELRESRVSIHRTVTTATDMVPLHAHTFYE